MTLISRNQVEQIALNTLSDSDLGPCEQAAITEALEYAETPHDARDTEAEAQHHLIADGLEKLANDLLTIAEAIRDKGGTF